MKHVALFTVFLLLGMTTLNISAVWQTGTLFGQEITATWNESNDNPDNDLVEVLSFSLRSQVIGNGGETSRGGSYQLSGTVGQATVGIHQGGSYSLISGFWHPQEATIPNNSNGIYLPFIQR